jgi:uracil-DNA glycosylase family 4
MTGLFSDSEVFSARPAGDLPMCGSCGLYKHCESPKMKPTGKGRKKILVVGEGPGENEDQQGIQLIGKSGQLLREVLGRIDVDLDLDCLKTNAVICKPEGTPTGKQVEACRPNLMKTIREFDPRVIILLGGTAVDSLIGTMWRADESPGPITRWVGTQIPSRRLNAWIFPTYHPAFLLRQNDSVLELIFQKHLQAAFRKKVKPWNKGNPELSSQVEILWDPAVAAGVLRGFVLYGKTVTIDIETDRLKPDHNDARIVCAAVCCDGTRTIAFPWQGDAVKSVGELLRSDIKKWGWSIKFEDRWFRSLGIKTKGWEWDGMVATHVLDNRQGITSLKFQAFVRLGQEPYDASVHQYLTADGGGNSPNRIREANQEDLLRYCGMDALCEYLLCKTQRAWMGAE